ncbi:hypothetical protein BGZ98_000722 [Dissophora globulifera]|nr:hypothetical protein BGZ98_000722 [Dissophora globulifera]
MRILDPAGFPGDFSLANPLLASAAAPFKPEDCPPCFNCALDAFPCTHFAPCSSYDGRCTCPPGFAGDNCGEPVCGSLADGSDRPRRGNEDTCKCKDGWSGINCNVCEADNVCDSLVPTGKNGTCYKGGYTVHENFQQCDVTNVKYDDVVTTYKCENITCACIPDRMLCGQDGGVNLDDFLADEVKGPADFVCTENNKCTFQEPEMNSVISDLFGDPAIYLNCHSGECLHYTQVPGFIRPPRPDNTWAIVLSIAGVFIFLFGLGASVFYLARNPASSSQGFIALPDDEAAKLMAEHIPAALMFKDVSYTVGGKEVLQEVSGIVKPGQLMAIMGASGAGKTSLLDILARRQKTGTVRGHIYVNGRVVSNQEYKRVVGYVDQEDTLMPTLTVYETIFYSALLRLPRAMSYEAKRFRVMETMSELGILGIKDMKIGASGQRSISGGEKRRVSIACELVTSPSILFLDEPTSGLDSYNAHNVIECLVTLARTYHRTVVCTIHQPRSNIFALFDQLVLMAKGHLVYSGETKNLNSHFRSLGHACPEGYNMADYMIDLTMYTGRASKPVQAASGPGLAYSAQDERDDEQDQVDNEDEEEEPVPASYGSGPLLQTRRFSRAPSIVDDSMQWESELASREQDRPNPRRMNSAVSNRFGPAGFDTRVGIDPVTSITNGSENLGGLSDIDDNGDGGAHLQSLVDGFKQSHSLLVDVEEQIDIAVHNAGGSTSHGSGFSNNNSAAGSNNIMTTYQRASWWSQFKILADRTLKNIYRDPMLMLAHYCMSIFLGLLCGALFYKVTDDIPGFQNRMGVFFFMCSLFGFSCLSILPSFAQERILFVRERANGYYAPWTYYLSKVLFDIVPLRVIPPMLMGLVIYTMVGLVEEWTEFGRFFLVLVLFNFTAAGVCLMIGIVFEEVGVANLMSSLVMLFSMLFGGLFLNKDSIPKNLAWLQKLSFFNYAFEALLVNEIAFLHLIQKEYGLSIDVPGSVILSTFGFRSTAYWKDVQNLGIMAGTFFVVGYIWLHFRVNERR